MTLGAIPIRALSALSVIAALASTLRASELSAPDSSSAWQTSFSRAPKVTAITAFDGSVLTPEGAPARGAVIVSSAGGRAISDVYGRFHLEVALPSALQQVRVTAVQSGGSTGLSASIEVPVLHDGSTHFVGILRLQLGAGCQPDWLPTFGGRPGMNAPVLALAVFDDGGGPALYAGGEFTQIGALSASHIAKWDGTAWSALGSGLNGEVRAFSVFDGGGGSALYVGGSFTTAGGFAANRIAKWDGSVWSPLGSGTNGDVHALAVFDDQSGGGPALYAGGAFSSAGGQPLDNIAKWDGAAWSTVGLGLGDWVYSLTVFDDGGGAGPALYAGGLFVASGSTSANYIAKWDGATWSALGAGMDNWVDTLLVFDEGTGAGAALYSGGAFMTAGGITAKRVARWDGATWSAMGSGLSDTVRALAVFDDGVGGAALYAAGSYLTTAGRVAKWNGSAWIDVNTSINDPVLTLLAFDDGAGAGPELYAGGEFIVVSGARRNRLAKWDGNAWWGVGPGLNASVLDTTVFDDGRVAGPALYAGGAFTKAGASTLNRVGKWDGTSWSALGAGPNWYVHVLCGFDDGSGPLLYAGTTAGLYAWDGSAWSPSLGANGAVQALTVFDDGSGGGPALYVGGSIDDFGGGGIENVAKWDGSTWSPLGSGTNDSVAAFAVYDDGSGGGPALYAAGWFIVAGGHAARRIARWDGASWSSLGWGLDYGAICLSVFDDGGGPALFVGGLFAIAGDTDARHIAKWTGSSWRPVGAGTDNTVSSLTVFDDGAGGGPALHVGGGFLVSPAGDSYLAKWGCSSGPGVAYCFGDGSGTPCPCGNAGGPGEGCANSTGSGAVLGIEGGASVSADDVTFLATHLLPNQPATLFVGENTVNNGDGLLFGDGLRCAGGGVERLGMRVPNGNGEAAWGPGLAPTGGWTAGDTRRFQVWYRNPTGSPCATHFNLSNGFELTFTR